MFKHSPSFKASASRTRKKSERGFSVYSPGLALRWSYIFLRVAMADGALPT